MKKACIKNKFKKGAASFYMVAIATLVLVVLATSFVAIMIAEISRTSNADLAQSAYDAAMAGVEDARLAYYNYSNCVENGGSNCKETYLGNGECNSFAESLGRQVESGGVKVQEESSSGNNIEQVYTCVKVNVNRESVDLWIPDENTTRVVPVRLAEGISAKDIKSVEISWGEGWGDDVDEMPLLEVGLIQTGRSDSEAGFGLSQFERTVVDNADDERTNRGAVYLRAKSGNDANDSSDTKDWFAKSNDKTPLNAPHDIYCGNGSNIVHEGYPCTVTIILPEPVGEGKFRSDDNFLFTWSFIGSFKGKKEIGIKMRLCTTKTNNCEVVVEDEATSDEAHEATGSSAVELDMQVDVDSTGRANDLFRRVRVTLDKEPPKETQKIYAVMAETIKKTYRPTCENNFVDVDNRESPNCLGD